MYKTYQLKLKNNAYFDSLFREAKWYYNTILASEDIFKFDTKIKTAFLTPEISKEVEYLSSQMRQEVKKSIISSIKGLSVKKKKGKRVGKLKFRGFLTAINLKNQTFRIKNQSVKFQGNRKSFSLRGVKQLPDDYKIKSGTLTRNPFGVYLQVTVEEVDKSNIKVKEIGLDMGVKYTLTFSDGTKVNTDFSQQERKIKAENRNLSRKKKGSKNREKCKLNLRKLYHRLSNQKNDTTNKIINKLKPYKVYYQDELLSKWTKSFGKKTHKSILGRVKEELNDSSNLMLKSDYPTTQLCPDCGVLNKFSLSERVYKCDCGYKKDRDVHAAQNMITIGSGRSYVETKTSIFDSFRTIESKFLLLKQEAVSL